MLQDKLQQHAHSRWERETGKRQQFLCPSRIAVLTVLINMGTKQKSSVFVPIRSLALSQQLLVPIRTPARVTDIMKMEVRKRFQILCLSKPQQLLQLA